MPAALTAPLWRIRVLCSDHPHREGRPALAHTLLHPEGYSMGTKPLRARPPVNLLKRFEEAFHDRPSFVVRAPGRVDIIGAHTDYNEGWVLPAAVNRYVWLAVRELPSALVALRALDFGGEEAVFRLTDLETARALDGQPLPQWARYAAGVAWSLQEAGLATPGTQIAIASDVPIGVGLASSAAVEVAYAVAWAHIIGWEVDRMELALLCQRAENEYVGVRSGLMDQFASLFGKANHALLFDCRTREWSPVPLSDQVTLVVADTGTRRTLAESPYNQRRAECEQAVRALQRYLPHIRALRDLSPEELEEHMDVIPEPARQRARHVVAENERVRAAARALRVGEVTVLGELMDESYLSARDLFEASGPELEALWQASLGHPARLGGRFIGAGWAGCMVFLVASAEAEDFGRYLTERYQQAGGHTPTLYYLQAADGAQVLPPHEVG